MKKNKKTIGILVIILAVVLIVWISSENRDQPAPEETETIDRAGDSAAVQRDEPEPALDVTLDEADSLDASAGAELEEGMFVE